MFDNEFEIVYLIGLVVGSVIRKIHTRHYWKNKVAFRGRTLADSLLVGVASVGMILPLFDLFSPWLDFANYRLPGWAGWLGAVVFVAALLLLWRSHVDLGRNWSVSPQIWESHTLATGGAFRYVRHPMYAAHWLWALAQALLLHNWMAGPAMLVCFLPLYLYRVPREEKMMLDHFGEEYRAYMRRTGRVIPRFWT